MSDAGVIITLVILVAGLMVFRWVLGLEESRGGGRGAGVIDVPRMPDGWEPPNPGLPVGRGEDRVARMEREMGIGTGEWLDPRVEALETRVVPMKQEWQFRPAAGWEVVARDSERVTMMRIPTKKVRRF